MSYLELTNVQKSFGETVAVKDFNLSISKVNLFRSWVPAGVEKPPRCGWSPGLNYLHQVR